MHGTLCDRGSWLKRIYLGANVVSGEAVVLEIPARAEYLALCRLAVAGLGAAAGLEEDEVADLKVAVSEACSSFVAKKGDSGSGEDHVTLEAASSQDPATLKIDFTLAADSWTVDITGPATHPAGRPSTGGGTGDEGVGDESSGDESAEDESDLGMMVMQAMVSEVRSEQVDSEVSKLTLVRYLA